MSLKTWIATKFIQGKFPDWIYRLVGEKIAKILKLENNMEETKSKWKSKTVWTAIVTVIVAGIEPISTAFGHPIVVPIWVLQFLAGFGLYSLRTAKTTIE